MRPFVMTLTTLAIFGFLFQPASAGHFDIAPYLDTVQGKIFTGGLDHSGSHLAPPITVYGYDFGEDPFDPYNLTDPGVNQNNAVAHNLPAGSALRWRVLSSLLYWDGIGEPSFGLPPENTLISFGAVPTFLEITGTSGPQATEGMVQTIGTNPPVHKHLNTSLVAGGTPATGIYAYSIELSLTKDNARYATDPLWMVFNNGMSEDAHDAAMDHFATVPEPESMTLLLVGLSCAVAFIRKKIG